MESLKTGGFQIAINVKAVDYPENKYFSNTLTVKFRRQSHIIEKE